METIEQNLANWRTSLMEIIPIGGLISRNATAYKWKAPFRCWMLRELTFWRLTDLLTQSCVLYRQGHGLGARILLRSGFETLAILLYLNQILEQVLEGNLDFHMFSRKTSILLLGSRDGSTEHNALNIVTILNKCDKRYPGLVELYGNLSESAHPNYEGMAAGYSTANNDEYETRFANRWMDIHGERHLNVMRLCMETFHREYDDVWPNLMEKLESWIATHDAHLEATKNDPLPNGA
ncbi:hypothetical protein [Rhizobium arsenicireducens]